MNDDDTNSLGARARNHGRLRAASALEDAGELRDAARLFEVAGEHAQAANLHLEHAQTLRDDRRRIMALREGATRNSGESEQGRALHAALARALLGHAQALPEGALRRGLSLEAASAHEEADEGSQAGELYEAMGLLHRAAQAYEAAGAITRLEFVLAILEHQERAAQDLARAEAEIDSAMRLGRRKLAHRLLLEHKRHCARQGLTLQPNLERTLGLFDHGLPRRRRLLLSSPETGQAIRIVSGHTLRIGRAPDSEFPVDGTALSRDHAAIELHIDPEGNPKLRLADRGSRAGSFWDGDPLDPGEWTDLNDSGELGLGIALALELVPTGNHERPAVFVRACGALGPWTLFAPLGCDLAMGPEQIEPATLVFDDPYTQLIADAGVTMWLENEPLGPGAPVELLVHDRLRLRGTDDEGNPVNLVLVVREYLEQTR